MLSHTVARADSARGTEEANTKQQQFCQDLSKRPGPCSPRSSTLQPRSCRLLVWKPSQSSKACLRAQGQAPAAEAEPVAQQAGLLLSNCRLLWSSQQAEHRLWPSVTAATCSPPHRSKSTNITSTTRLHHMAWTCAAPRAPALGKPKHQHIPPPNCTWQLPLIIILQSLGIKVALQTSGEPQKEE